MPYLEKMLKIEVEIFMQRFSTGELRLSQRCFYYKYFSKVPKIFLVKYHIWDGANEVIEWSLLVPSENVACQVKRNNVPLLGVSGADMYGRKIHELQKLSSQMDNRLSGFWIVTPRLFSWALSEMLTYLY